MAVVIRCTSTEIRASCVRLRWSETSLIIKGRIMANDRLSNHHFPNHIHQLIKLDGVDANRRAIAGPAFQWGPSQATPSCR